MQTWMRKVGAAIGYAIYLVVWLARCYG